MKAIHLKIRGTVQGVFFRAETKEVADSLGITGWVRNLSDGSVEVFAQGEENALEKFEAWCTHGPPGAVVTQVVKMEQKTAKLKGFSIRYS